MKKSPENKSRKQAVAVAMSEARKAGDNKYSKALKKAAKGSNHG